MAKTRTTPIPFPASANGFWPTATPHPGRLGHGTQMRDFIHIDDCVTGVLTTMDQIDDGGALNLSTGIFTSFIDFARLAANLAGFDPEVKRHVRQTGGGACPSRRHGQTEAIRLPAQGRIQAGNRKGAGVLFANGLMIPVLRLCWLIFLFALLPGACTSRAPAKTQTLYVAPNGDDRWTGAQPTAGAQGNDGPLRSLSAAVRQSRRGAATARAKSIFS